ncbi:MAG: hypothetical protein V4633_03085 [Pseudomonadota bacterium]
MKIAAMCWLVLALPPGASVAGPINIVRNPGFESGIDFWKMFHFALGPNEKWAHSGTRQARLTFCDTPDCLDTFNEGAFITQALATTPGEHYDLSFWVRSISGESGFSVFWDGALLFKSGTPNGPMLEYVFAGLEARSDLTLLQIHAYNTLDEHVSFDDFVVTASDGVAVHEPSVWSLLIAGMGVLAAARVRKS